MTTRRMEAKADGGLHFGASAGPFTWRADALDAGTEGGSIRGRRFGACTRPTLAKDRRIGKRWRRHPHPQQRHGTGIRGAVLGRDLAQDQILRGAVVGWRRGKSSGILVSSPRAWG